MSKLTTVLMRLQSPLLCSVVGVLGVHLGLSVTRDWEVWALIGLTAANGVQWFQG